MSPLLTHGFRPFFLLAALQAMFAMAAWFLALHGHAFGPLPDVAWHAHAMLAGFGGAVLAGFLMTAVANWTGRPPVSGTPLAWLAASWLLGRIAMMIGEHLPAGIVLAADMLFPLGLLALFGRELLAAGNRRNYPVLALLLAWALLNLVFHLDRAETLPGASQPALLLMAHLLLVLITLIAGRIIPAFTGNWLRMNCPATQMPVSHAWIEKTVVPLAVVTALADAAMGSAPVTGALALLLAAVHAARLSGWRGGATLREPLLFALHLAYGAMLLGYLLLGLAALGAGVPRSSGFHMLTTGAIGGMMLAMMARVTLGHTGRALTAGLVIRLAFLLLAGAALARAASPLLAGLTIPLMSGSSALWIGAFALYLASCAPMLVQPRPG